MKSGTPVADSPGLAVAILLAVALTLPGQAGCGEPGAAFHVAENLFAAVGLFIGFSGIQQTLGFQLQDKMSLMGAGLQPGANPQFVSHGMSPLEGMFQGAQAGMGIASAGQDMGWWGQPNYNYGQIDYGPQMPNASYNDYGYGANA